MKPATQKPKAGDVVRVNFLDHCEGGDGKALEFTVFGIVRKIDRRIIQIGCWVYADGFDREDGNETHFDIVRKAITTTKILK